MASHRTADQSLVPQKKSSAAGGGTRPKVPKCLPLLDFIPFNPPLYVRGVPPSLILGVYLAGERLRTQPQATERAM